MSWISKVYLRLFIVAPPILVWESKLNSTFWMYFEPCQGKDYDWLMTLLSCLCCFHMHMHTHPRPQTEGWATGGSSEGSRIW